MGCGLSKQPVGVDGLRRASVTNNDTRNKSLVTPHGDDPGQQRGDIGERRTTWKKIETPNDYKGSGKISNDEIELRIVLSEPLGQKHIGNFAKEIFTSETFFCWVEINEFLHVPSQGFRKCLAKHIYEKYIREGAKMALGGLSQELIDKYKDEITQANTNIALFNNEFFKPIERECLKDMCRNTYKLFKASPQYQLYKKELKETYNRVTITDFEYLECLGSGGFGRVVHARKISTGRHYAMKIQLKTGLLDEHKGDLSKLASEKVIFQACNHPFIVDMQYSFQTDKYVIIVLELVRGGDLLKLMRASKERRLSEDQVVLYASEVALALNHLHEMGLLYRDLKPANILLTEKGHIKLADMGLAGGTDLDDPEKLTEMDDALIQEDEVIRQNRESLDAAAAAEVKSTDEESNDEPAAPEGESASNVAKRANSIVSTAGDKSDTSAQKFLREPRAKHLRRKTTVGTRGYMAPEMLRGKLQKRADRKGYNHSVDYWSLGITLFELLTGKIPFAKVQVHDSDPFLDMDIGIPVRVNPRKETEDELRRMEKEIVFPSYVSAEARDFICRLIDTNEDTRMGCATSGFMEVMQHPFLKSIDWDKLIVNHVNAEVVPFVKPISEKPKTMTFDEIMHKFDTREREARYNWYESPADDQQVYFETWDYVSPSTLKAELGIATAMDESNLPYKVIQLTGETQK